MMEQIYITDVAPRDGLQNQPVFVSTQAKLQLIRLLAEAGVRSIEATSFVSPNAVPQMADADELVPNIGTTLPDLRISALVPNLRGLERAHAAGVAEIAVVVGPSETMNRKNVNMGFEQATVACEQTLAQAQRLGLRTRAYVGVAYDCPFEGPTPLDAVISTCARMLHAGADEIVVADTIGSASPGQVRSRLSAIAQLVPIDRLGAHFHDTRGMGVANVWAALDVGVRRFDASVGGIGGCPFAPGASGNIATEDLVLMAEQSGFSTGIEWPRLLEAVEFAESQLGRPLGGHAIAWMRRQRNK